jgi:hypothetical protein
MLPLLDEGVYRGWIIEWGFGSSSKKGTPYFEIAVVLTHKEDDFTGSLFELDRPYRRSVLMYLTGGARPITDANLRYLGYTDTDLARLDTDHPEAHSLEGREVYVTVAHEEYQGREKEKIQLLRRSVRQSLAEAPLSADIQAAFAAAQEKAAEAERRGRHARAPQAPEQG